MKSTPRARVRSLLVGLCLVGALVGCSTGPAAPGNDGSGAPSASPDGPTSPGGSDQTEPTDPSKPRTDPGNRRIPAPALPLRARPNDDRPNIVLFLLDDMRADEMRYMPKTRAVINSQGTYFTDAISPHPLCCPARAELVSGQYGQNNGVQHNVGPLGGFKALKDSGATVATWLHRSGYATGYEGKYLNGYSRGADDGRDAQPGWNIFDPLVGNVSAYTHFKFADGDTFGAGGVTGPVDGDYISGRIAQRTDQMLKKMSRPGSPFFLFINHTAPHRTHPDRNVGGPETDPTYEDRYADKFKDAISPALGKPSFDYVSGWEGKRQDRAEMQSHFTARLRALQSADAAVARTVASLRASGELDNTYLVFTSDNGFAIGEHGYDTKNILMREVLDVPLAIAGPGIKAGAQRDEVVSLVDLSRTFLDMAGVKVKHALDGRSLLPLARGERAPRWRDTTLVQTGNSRTDGPYPGWAARGVQTQRYLYGAWVNRDPDALDFDFLYDRTTDPYEINNVVNDPRYAVVVAELQARAQELTRCSGAASCNRVYGPLPDPGTPTARLKVTGTTR